MSLLNSRPAIPWASSLRREIPVFDWRFASSMRSSGNAGFIITSTKMGNNVGKSSFKAFMDADPELKPMPVLITAALSSSMGFSTSAGYFWLPPERITDPVIEASPTLSIGSRMDPVRTRTLALTRGSSLSSSRYTRMPLRSVKVVTSGLLKDFSSGNSSSCHRSWALTGNAVAMTNAIKRNASRFILKKSVTLNRGVMVIPPCRL